MKARRKIWSGVRVWLPLGFLGVALGAITVLPHGGVEDFEDAAMEVGEHPEATVASSMPLAASFGGKNRGLGRIGRKARTRKGSSALFSKLRLKRPKVRSPRGRAVREITIAKSSAEYKGIDFSRPRRNWKYINRGVRRQIDGGVPRRNRWQMIVVHNSSTKKGNAKAFDYYHRNVKGMRNGLAYHFVIGNGTYSGDGEIEVGKRWLSQIDGGHLRSSSQNKMAIGICLVGDFNSDRVSKKQLESLDELIDYLEAKVGDVNITTHKQVNVRPTDCPGKYFPEQLVTTPGKR